MQMTYELEPVKVTFEDGSTLEIPAELVAKALHHVIVEGLRLMVANTDD